MNTEALRLAQEHADWIFTEAGKARGKADLQGIRARADAISAAILTMLDGAVEPEPDPIIVEPGDWPTPTGEVHVPAGSSLQAAVNNAPAGTLITLEPGATYEGTVTLPNVAGATPSRITTRGFNVAVGTRAVPGDGDRMALVRSGTVQAAIRTAPGAAGWILNGLECGSNVNGQHEVIELGQAWDTKTLDGLPSRITLAHILMRFPGPQKRGIGANGIDVTIRDSYLTGMWITGQDSQAIAAWNTPGPLRILNNHLEAGSEVIMFGGADPGITNVVVTDALVEGNTLTRPVTWRGDASKVVKNLFEIKAGVRVTVRENLMEHHWQAAQPGWSLVLTPRNQDGRCTACRVEDILIERNVVRNVSGGFNILATDNLNPSGQARRITICDNLFEIDHRVWGGNGRFMLMQGNVANLHVEHNTILQSGTQFLSAYGAPAEGFHCRGNLIKTTGAYGMHVEDALGENRAHGIRWEDGAWKGILHEHFPGYFISENAFVDWQGNAASRAQLAGNLFVTSAQAEVVDGYGVNAVEGYGRRRA